MISDRSGGLSVGQSQRLALARAMIQNGNFWLLDEPTASLDARSEKLVMKGIHSNIADNTALLVTHQLAPLQSVDTIIVMQSGLIEEQGSYQDLANAGGLFEEMLNANLAQQTQDKGNLDA